MCDLLIIVNIFGFLTGSGINNIHSTITSLDKHKFKNKYIIISGPPTASKQKDISNIKKYYPDFNVIDYTEPLEFRDTLEKFIKTNYNQFSKTSKNLFVIKNNIIIDNFDLDNLLETKSLFNECLILYFRENILRLNHWFTEIKQDDSVLIKTHGFCENCFICSKEYLNLIFNSYLQNNGKFISYHYNNCIKNKTDEEQLEIWKNWGIYEHKSIRHKVK